MSTTDQTTTALFNALPSPLESIPDLRAAAKWIIAAFGTIGVSLVGGGPLVAVGRIHGLRDALIAGAALLIAITGVSLAVWKASQVLIPPVTTIATLNDPSLRRLRGMIDASPADFFGPTATGVADLLRHRDIAANLAQALRTETDPRRRQHLQHHARRATANLARTSPHLRWLLAMAHVWQIRSALRGVRVWCVLALVLITIGAVAFFTVTGGSRA
jgi:hypothetical protein